METKVKLRDFTRICEYVLNSGTNVYINGELAIKSVDYEAKMLEPYMDYCVKSFDIDWNFGEFDGQYLMLYNDEYEEEN